MIDFSQLGQQNSANTAVHPRQIFNALPSNKYQYPRDVQTEVWNNWHNSRDDGKDKVIKMNTGSGKTVVGLLILKSCLNEKKGPAVYLCPDNYLVEQVKFEADNLGIKVTEDTSSLRFLGGEEILVTNIYKLFNGQSQFGVNELKIDIQSVVIDDVHACISSVAQQFNLQVFGKVQEELLELFFDDLKGQSPGTLHDIKEGQPQSELLVPYWAWQSKIDTVRSIISEHSDEDALLFKWPLINNILELSDCFISGRKVEISIRTLPIDIIRSFREANRRIFMSATLADDSVLVSHFDAHVDNNTEAITPNIASDAGDRLILLPKHLNPKIGNNEIRKLAREYANKINAIVIVPSHYRAQFWEEYADLIIDRENISEAVESLRNGHVGLAVLINKYDGVDLPEDACRLLIVDELPDARRSIDRYDQRVLYNSGHELIQPIQKIEQGIGRGVRSSQDYCAVILMGDTLTKQLVRSGGINRFTSVTKVQYDLSTQISEQLRDQDISILKEALDLFLSRDSNWVKASKSRLSEVEYNSELKLRDEILKLRKAFNEAVLGRYKESAEVLESAKNEIIDQKLKGLLSQELARIQNFISSTDAQVMQQSAVSLNNTLLKPLRGTEYKRLSSIINQSKSVLKRLKEDFETGRELAVYFNQLSSQLLFVNSESNTFENAIMKVGWYIGFESHRPDAEFGTGPDNLWQSNDNLLVIIECKNESEAAEISKSDCNQVSGHVHWAKDKYPKGFDYVPIIIHPSKDVSELSSPDKGMLVITENELSKLRESIKSFSFAISTYWDTLDEDIIASQLQSNFLNSKQIIENYTVRYRSR